MSWTIWLNDDTFNRLRNDGLIEDSKVTECILSGNFYLKGNYRVHASLILLAKEEV